MSQLNVDKLNVQNSVVFPSFTDATRPTAVANGQMIYNSEQERLQYWDGTQWKNVLEPRDTGLGLTPTSPAESAAAIKAANPDAENGVYWIDLPFVGATETYCLMDDEWDGGGWMLMLKATQGTTFNHDSNYWTTDNTLNETDLNLDDGDAKFAVMNYFEGNDFMALWPDVNVDGGCIGSNSRGIWTWLQTNYNDGVRITPIDFFSIEYTTVNAGGSGKYIMQAKNWCGYSTSVFSSQPDIQFYGFNYKANNRYNNRDRCATRWGFGWNENSEGIYPSSFTGAYGSNDVGGGIGLGPQWDSYSAGDHINCCQDNTGINRQARVEVYVR